MAEPETIEVELVYATAQGQQVRKLRVLVGTTVMAAIEAVGLVEAIPGVVVDADHLGIFARKVTPDHRLEQGDRIEIYRPLQRNPMDARRQRARSDRKSPG
jgi:putative ubiquitin-RnfH superfamily antitoxin RatB of RatAB toxin-antitoxin module